MLSSREELTTMIDLQGKSGFVFVREIPKNRLLVDRFFRGARDRAVHINTDMVFPGTDTTITEEHGTRTIVTTTNRDSIRMVVSIEVPFRVTGKYAIKGEFVLVVVDPTMDDKNTNPSAGALAYDTRDYNDRDYDDRDYENDTEQLLGE